jgi:hypothetical protein
MVITGLVIRFDRRVYVLQACGVAPAGGEAIRKAREAGLEQARLRRLARHRQQREDTTSQDPDDVG